MDTERGAKGWVQSPLLRKFILFAGLVALLLVVLLLGMRVRKPDTVTFAFTADTQGFLVPCGCSVTPSGGLARRATFLETLRKERPGVQVVPVEITHPFADRGPGRDLLNRTMADFFRAQGYGMVGLGPFDLELGPRGPDSARGLPLYLAGAKGLKGSAEYPLGGWGVGSFVYGGKRLRVVALSEGGGGTGPQPSAMETFEAEKKLHRADAWIVVGRLNPETATKLVNGAPGVLAVVAQWSGIVTTAPQNALDKWVVYMGDRGRRICTLDVTRYEKTWSVLPSVRYLDGDLKSDPATERSVEEVLSQVAQINRSALAAATRPPEPGRRYLGASRCAPCHIEEFRAWAPTGHARAREKLKVDHQEENPDCLACHATAMGEPGGFPQEGVALEGVQCEACHGPGEGHPPGKMVVRNPSPEACGHCHTQRDSPMFDAEGFWQLIRHGKPKRN